MKKILFLSILLFSIKISFAQTSITGKVSNENAEELIGVNISVPSISGLGAITDIDGSYTLVLTEGCKDIRFQYIGYKDHIENICLEQNETQILNIVLQEDSEVLGTVVVSAGKFEQALEEVTVSMDVIKPALIENKSSASLDRTLNQSPSVHVVDGQANIRSGSGWSYGAGSRVMVMMDGMPLMGGDQGNVEWHLIPMENISQIEVIKGASSVLFGSSALNGTINIRTAYPTSEPLNKLNIIHSTYGKPNREELHWYKNGYTSSSNISFLHSHKKDNKDFVLGTNLMYDGGFMYRVYSKRARINASLTNYSKKVEGLSYGIKTNIMRSKIGDAIIWEHDSLAYMALDDDPGYRNNSYISIDPFITFNNPEKGIKHSINSRYYRINFYKAYTDSIQFSDQEAKRYSNVYFLDYQIQKQRKEFLTLTSGYTYKYSDGQDMVIYGNHYNVNHSLYSQADIKYKNINLSLGARHEHFNDEGVHSNKTIFRSGINYKVGKATYLRGSYGEGVRFPSIVEKFVTFNTGPVYIYPNEDIEAETGWSSEIGLKQGIKIGKWKGFIDLAGFVMEYNNMLEFSFGKWGPSNEGLAGLGFKSINIGNTRIEGLEISMAGEGKIGQTELTIMGSYTYTSPYIEDIHNVYDEYITISGDDTIINPVSYATTSLDTSGVLKYRYEHLAKLDVNIERNRFSVGFSLRYNGAMKNIDAIFVDPVLFEPSLGTLSSWNRLNKDVTIFDARIAYDLTENSRISFNVDNLFNTEFLLRPAALGRPRTYSILYKIVF